MLTRIIQPNEASAWARMREQLWPGQRAAHDQEIAAFFRGERRDPARQ